MMCMHGTQTHVGGRDEHAAHGGGNEYAAAVSCGSEGEGDRAGRAEGIGGIDSDSFFALAASTSGKSRTDATKGVEGDCAHCIAWSVIDLQLQLARALVAM